MLVEVDQAVKRTAIRRRTPLKQGWGRDVVRRLDEVARAICMTKGGAFRVEGSSAWVGICRKCKLTRPLQWCHFNSRRIHSLRWADENTMTLCAGCHYAFAHHKPAEFRDWWREEIGAERFDRLALRLKTASRVDYAGLLVALRQEWLQLTGDKWSEAK